MIYFDINFYLIDSWDPYPVTFPDHFEVYFDSTRFSSSGISSYFIYNCPDYCGNSLYGDVLNVPMVGKVLHSATSVVLKVISRMDNPTDNESFGFRDISLNFVPSPPDTTEYACQPNNPSSATANLITYCLCPKTQYTDPSSGTCMSCNSLCSYCFGANSNQCTECRQGAWFDGTKCLACGDDTKPYLCEWLMPLSM